MPVDLAPLLAFVRVVEAGSFAEAARRAGTSGIAPKPRHISDDAHAAVALVRAGFGVGCGPAWLMAQDLKSGRLVEVLRDLRIPEEPLWLLRTSGRQPPKRTLRTMQFLAALPRDGAV